MPADDSADDGASAGVECVSAPADAFQALGNDVRTGILETMLERERADDEPSRASFSALFEAADVETSAGFAYHLEQLVGPYLRKREADESADTDDEGGGYELTYAGRRIAREIETGAYTRRVDHPPVALDDDCPFCGREALAARSADNVVTVACADCDRAVLDLGFPPSGIETHGEAFPDALDRYHRHRLGRMRDGVCPECGGTVAGALVEPSADVAADLPSEHAEHVQAEFACDCCGARTRCPVGLTLLDHAAVVSFYREHGRDVDERPIWNVGSEWAEAVLSTDPLAVRVVVELEGDVLALYVDESLSVADVQRSDRDAESGSTRDESAASPTESTASGGS